MSEVNACSGFSGQSDTVKAVEEAVGDAVGGLEDPEQVFLFASSHYDQEVVAETAGDVTEASVVGCSTAGEIHGTDSFTDHVVALAVGGDLESFSGVSEIQGEGYEAGAEVSEDLLESLGDGSVPLMTASEDDGWDSFPEQFVVALGSGLTGDNQAIMEGVSDVMETLIGGAWAADDWSLEQTYLYRDGELLEDSMLLTALDLDVKTGLGVRHGLEQDVEEVEVTSSDGNRVKKLGDQDALSYYKDHFGERATNSQFLLTKPLGINTREEELRIREPLDIDEEEGDLIFSENIEEGWTVHLMEASSDQVMQGAEDAVEMALEDAGDPDDVEAVLVHNCACRWYFLNQSDSLEDELEIVQEKVGEDVPVVGWYTYGEIAYPGSLAGIRHQNMVLQVITSEER